MQNHHGLENPIHLYSSYPLSIGSLCKAFSKSLIHLALQKAFKIGIISSLHRRNGALGTLKHLVKVMQLKMIKAGFKTQYSYFQFYDTALMAPSSKFQLPKLLVTSSSDNHPSDWHVNCKTCNRSADIWGARETTGCFLNATF